MNISKNRIDDLNLQLTLEVVKEDYEETLHKQMNDLRRRADIKGFRKGMAPMGLIQRLYGDQALYETINGVVSDSLNNFIRDEKLHVVGEPLPSEDQPELEWKAGNSFTFKFDIAETPDLTFTVDKNDKVVFYQINITETAKKEMKKNMLQQLGTLQEASKSKAGDYLIVDFDNGEVTAEGVYVSISNVAEAHRDAFIGRKAGDKFVININEAFVNETDRAAMIKVDKSKLAGINPEFNVTVVNVKTFVAAEENQETWDKMFGEGVVTTPEQFDEKVAERLRANYESEASFRFSKDAKQYFLDKAAVALPEAFLKRWLIYINKDKFTPEQVDAEFEGFLADFRWQLVRGHILQLFGLKVEDKDIKDAAKGYAAYQYAMYGMGNVPDSILDDAVANMLKDENQVRRFEEQVEDTKCFDAIRANVTLQNKKISEDKFRELN